MNKHAYLIIAHNNWGNLEVLIRHLDDTRNDIYLHIDKNAIGFDKDKFLQLTKYSKIHIYSERKVYWGGYSMTECELLLLKKSIPCEYQYYHILSGADLPIKSQDEIHKFFQTNAGYEFVQFEEEEFIEKEESILRRVTLFHFLQNFRRRFQSEILNQFFTFADRMLLAVQLAFGVNRWDDKYLLRYGSNWVSITHKLAVYLVENEALIKRKFRNTSCSDELFIQTLVFNSTFKEKVYHPASYKNVTANMRLIDWKRGNHRGNPYVWHEKDFTEIMRSECLFARKFDYREDSNIIQKIDKEILRRRMFKKAINT